MDMVFNYFNTFRRIKSFKRNRNYEFKCEIFSDMRNIQLH